MADSNLNPAPRNVSAIDGKQGIDISGVGQYDENTSLDDIAGSYINTGKQLGQIVSQAAEHVGDIQNKLVNNDFGAVNPYMYNTYYQPGANEIQSDWRISGTQKALEVGMERGKAAAEAAAKAAQNNYNNAVNNFNQAVANPTIATLDTSQLGEGNTVEEFIAANDFSGSAEDVQRRYLQNGVFDRYGADWSNTDRWAKTAQATIQNAGISQETYDSWSDEQRQAFWDSNEATIFFNNYFIEDEIRETMGEESLAKYRESYQSVSGTIQKIYDYYNHLTDEIQLEPIKLIQRSYGDVTQETQNIQTAEFALGAPINDDKTAYDVASNEEWIDKNVREDKREEFKKWVEEHRQEHTSHNSATGFGIATGVPRGAKYYTLDKNALAEFAKDKLIENAKSIYGADITNTVNMGSSDEKSTEDTVRSIVGFDVDTLRWYRSMKDEHPETLDVLKSQISQAYGETSTLEIADGSKWYLVNGEYVQPKAGTVILFAAPGVMDNDGKFVNKDYETFVDCFKKLNNAAANYSEEERKKLQDTMQEAWTKYYQSIYMLKIAESYTGGTMDENMYHAILYRMDPEKYKDLMVGDKKISDIVKEWKDMADKDGHGTYLKLAQLLNQAYSHNGFYYGVDANGELVQYSLEIGDTGIKTVGQVHEDNVENIYAGWSAPKAMALFSIVTASLQEHQRGNNQDQNVNPYFLDDDNAGFTADFGNSMLNIFSTMVDIPASLLTMGVGAVGNLFLPDDKKIDPADLKGWNFRTALATIWPENWGKEYWSDLANGVSAKELFTGAPKEGTLDYFVQVSNLQQQNLADAINPFMVEYWFGNEGDEKNIKRIGEGYTSRTKGLLDLGSASAFDVYGLNTMFANGTAFRESAAKLLGGFAGGYLAGFVTTGYKVAASVAMQGIKSGATALANNIRTEILIHSIKNTPNETVAAGMKNKILTQTLEQQAAKSNFGGSAALGPGNTSQIAATAAKDTDTVIRGMTDLALNPNQSALTEGFSTEFLEKSFSNAQTGGALASGLFTAEQAQAFTIAEQQIGQQMANAIMAETLETATLSLGTGLPAEAFSAMNSATQKMFMKAYNAVLNGAATATGKINVQAFLQSLGTEGIKEAAVKVAEESAAAAARGMTWTNSDTFRVLATLGWDGASTRALLTDFMADAAVDLVRDNLRNATNPYLTNEGWQRQTVEEYFANPWTYVQNMIYSGIHFAGQRVSGQIKDAFYSKQYDKHLKAYAAAGDNPDLKAEELAKVNQYINRIQKNNASLVRKGQPYSKLKNTSEKINEDLSYIITKQYEKSGINPITGETDTRFNSADEFNEYIKSKKLSTKDRINLANRGLVIETQNNFIMTHYELGGSDRTKLGNIKDWEINWDLQDIEQRTLDKYYDEVIHMKGGALDKQRRMYNLYTQEIMAKYGKTIPGLEAALNNYYGRYLTDLEAGLKANPNMKWTLGYTSLAGMTTLGDDSGNVMFGASFGNNFNTVDRNAADVDKSRAYRDIKRQLLDAIKRGDTELTITRADGKEKTYHLNKDGLNYLMTMTAYNNSNTVHKYYDPIFGDSVQTHEHKDQIPFAEAAYRSKDTIISGTKIATQAAESDAKAAQDIINKYTQMAYDRYKGTANEAIVAQRHKDITEANIAINVSESDRLYKLSQDRAAAERYVQQLDEEKHGELQHRYKEVLPLISEIDGKIGEIEAQREYRQAISNTKTAINMYLEGNLSEDNPVFKYKYGENETVEIRLDNETMGMIVDAAKNGNEFGSDLAMSMMIAKRNAVPARATDVNAEVARGDYDRVIRDLEYDTKVTGEDHTAEIIKLRQEMKAKHIYHRNKFAKGDGKSSSAIDYAYKQIEGTDFDTAKTGFKINGEDQLVKYAADDYYYLPTTGQKANPRRAQIIDAATEPLKDFLSQQPGGLTNYDERMIAYVANAAEQNLRNMDTGEERMQITVGALKKEIMKVAPDADLWTAAKASGAVERVSSLSRLGIQSDSMAAELKAIMAAHSNMPEATKNKFIDTINLYELMAENSNSIKANAFSLDKTIGNGEADEPSTYGDLMADSQSLVSSMRNSNKYEKKELKRMVQSAGDILGRVSNKNSKYSSELIRKANSDRTASSNIAKAVKKDLRTTAFEYYNKALENPTVKNTVYTDAAMSWARARYAADPKFNGQDLDNIEIKVNDIDCINALGSSNHEVMLSPYGDKNNHTYAEYAAAQNNIRGFDIADTNGTYSTQAKDYIRLTNATYGQSIEQAENSIKQLAEYFPEDKGVLLEKGNKYSLEGRRVAAQYMTEANLKNRIDEASGKTLENYGLGNMKTSEFKKAFTIANRLKKAKAEQASIAERPANSSYNKTQIAAALRNKIAKEGTGNSYLLQKFAEADTGKTPVDLSSAFPTRYLNNGQEDTAATIKTFKNATSIMNSPMSVAGEVEASATPQEYDNIIAGIRKELATIYRQAGLANGRKGRIPVSEIDAFGEKILSSYGEITRANGSGMASDMLTFNSITSDSPENSLLSVMSQTYDESARTTYDAQEKLLEKRTRNLNRQIKAAEKKAAKIANAGNGSQAPQGTFEVSTAGDNIGKKFSALNAKFNDSDSSRLYGQDLKGLTIEQAYQKLKGAGKGEAPAEDSQIGIMTKNEESSARRPLTKAEKEAVSLEAYTALWREWARQNPEAIEELRDASYGRKLTDKFARTSVTQATALETILKETDPLREPRFTREFSETPLKTPNEIQSAIEKTIGVKNLSEDSQKALKDYSDYINSETKKAEGTNEYKKLLDEYQQGEIENDERRRNNDAYYASQGIYSDDEDISGEWDYDDTRLDDFIYERVYKAKETTTKRDALVKTINDDIAAQRKARDEKYGTNRTQDTVSLLKSQLDETEKAIARHQLLDREANIRDGKTHFYTDQQILSSEFGRTLLNQKTVYGKNNYPAGLEIGEGKVIYTVSPAEDNVDIMTAKGDRVSSQKLKAYLRDKATNLHDRFSPYYEDMNLSFGKDFVDNGDGTYTIYGKYGHGDLDLHEQEALKIANWENMDMSDISAEKRAILNLSTSPIYHSYDEMVNIEELDRLIKQRKAINEEMMDTSTIEAINARRKLAYDQYIQLTNTLGKEYLDSLEAAKKYTTALNKERKAYKIDDIDQQTIKSVLTPEEYDEFMQAQETLFNVAKFQNSSDSGIYHARNGVIFAKDGYNPTGFVDTNIAKAILEGRAIETKDLPEDELKAQLNTQENRDAREEMQKGINKNQNKGSIHYKNSEAYKAIKNSAMDKLSARYTLNNYIEFENQTRDMLTGMGLADEYKILMDKDYSDMMQRIAGKNGGIEDDGVKAKFFDAMMHTANLNKTIQDWQLAGGFSNYNAATIAQIRGAIFNDPRMALEYLQVFTAAKNSNSTMNYVAQRRDFLYKMVALTGAGELVSDLNQAISVTPGEGDLGTINSLAHRILSHLDGSREVEGKNAVSRGFGRISDDMNALFSDATFINTLPLFKLRMLEINYDEALRYLQKFDGFEKLSADDVENACMWMSYAKTIDFLEPRKTRGSSWEEFTKNIANEELRRTAASWTGAKRDANIMDNMSTAFFALRWKMTFGGRVLNGLTNTPGAFIRKLKLRDADISNPETMALAGQQFMRSGNTIGIGTMMALSALAMAWNKNLGYDSVSWDDLNIIGEDGEFQVPNILKKFQTLGQFWLPNAKDENGRPIIDPTQKMFGLDPFSSIFTMSNTAARAFDRLVNPNAYAKNMQRGIVGSGSSEDFINKYIVNSPLFQAIGDEVIGANLLSPYKAMYEVLIDDTYFGNNIWEKRKLADGRDNPNYDPVRNVVAGFAHVLNFDWLLSGGTNKWVKGYGSEKYENTGKIGTVAGSGIFQHEFVTAAIEIMNGNALEGIIEAGEVPIKTKSISGSARTDFNVRIKNIITQYVQEYKDKVGSMTNLDAKDEEYAKLCKKCADVVADWSAKNKYVLGKDQELVAYVTKSLIAICAGEYNDNLDYVQNAYWKASQIAQIEQSEDLFLGDPDLQKYINEGKSVEEFAAEKNRRSEAYNQAIDDEYQARVALKAAGLPDSYLAAYEDTYGNKDKNDFKTLYRSVNKQAFAEIHGVLEGKIGEFNNFKEMKQYYEAQIEAATTTKQKAKLADKYNDILTEAIAPYVNKYGAAILSDGYYNNQNLANSIAEYVILPADQYYYGKTPRASYLRDLFHVGYRDNSAMPSDKEVYEKYTGAVAKIHQGASATAAAMLDRLLRDSKAGRIYISEYDYSRILRMKAQLNARSKQ